VDSSQRADALVTKLLHEAHVKYQRQQLAHERVTLPSSEVRGVSRRASQRERETYSQTFRPEWFTHLRPNFWKAYFETLIEMSK